MIERELIRVLLHVFSFYAEYKVAMHVYLFLSGLFIVAESLPLLATLTFLLGAFIEVNNLIETIPLIIICWQPKQLT